MTQPRAGDEAASSPGHAAAPDGARDPVEALVEEFFERRRRGERSDPDDFARRVPGREEEFRDLVEALAVLESAAAATPGSRALAGEIRERLGRFRLLRLIGRGGMGVVYEAVDDELGRHVALKVLPGHATLDEREIARFRREAQAAARLSHPHIVPVFGVGEDEGTHWLAMQFVPGRSLDALQRSWRDQGAPRLAPADVARHGLAIAEALACAHAEGVLHRDVKPSNLILDAGGEIWITDFGLAKSEGSASLTRTGETVGTPRYMAPEAFSGWADPRTDVWGLGATLYELLSGSPAFDGGDRAQLLRQITGVEPAPLRKRDPSIPRDLATIVHKCLQKEPAARYAGANEVAADLRRFLAGEPIHARPPSLAYRVGLIGRRHPVATALLFVALAAGAVMTLRETARARAAERQAQKRFDDVRRLAGSFLFEIEDAIRNLPGSTAARALVVRRSLEYLDRLAAESAGDRALRRDLAVAYLKVGDVQGNPYQPNLGDTDGARKSCSAASGLLEPMLASGEAGDDDRAILASAYLVLGGLDTAAGRPDDAASISRKGLELRRDLAAADPTPARREQLATAWQYHAHGLAAAGRNAEALAALDEQAAILRELLARLPEDPALQRAWSRHLHVRAHALEEKDGDAALKAYAEAVAIRRKQLASSPNDAGLRRDLAWALTDEANLLLRLGRRPESLARHREVLSITESLASADPLSVEARTGVALAHNNLASALVELGQPEDALAEASESIARCQALLAIDPLNTFVEIVLAAAEANSGEANAAFGDSASLETACDAFRRSVEILERMKAAGRLLPASSRSLERNRARLAACEARIER